MFVDRLKRDFAGAEQGGHRTRAFGAKGDCYCDRTLAPCPSPSTAVEASAVKPSTMKGVVRASSYIFARALGTLPVTAKELAAVELYQ